MSNIHGSSFRYPEVWRPADPAEAWQWKRRFGAEAAFAAGGDMASDAMGSRLAADAFLFDRFERCEGTDGNKSQA
ncbi:hypothetical protein [Cohnella faecalis]|uniref:hypothetical protein n=1 Tax=Cohnella faecalis TaxID=2315694 RepID=UPI001F3C7879|nr:hypothetical protein [Cohnella faecalis]